MSSDLVSMLTDQGIAFAAGAVLGGGLGAITHDNDEGLDLKSRFLAGTLVAFAGDLMTIAGLNPFADQPNYWNDLATMLGFTALYSIGRNLADRFYYGR